MVSVDGDQRFGRAPPATRTFGVRALILERDRGAPRQVCECTTWALYYCGRTPSPFRSIPGGGEAHACVCHKKDLLPVMQCTHRVRARGGARGPWSRGTSLQPWEVPREGLADLDYSA